IVPFRAMIAFTAIPPQPALHFLNCAIIRARRACPETQPVDAIPVVKKKHSCVLCPGPERSAQGCASQRRRNIVAARLRYHKPPRLQWSSLSCPAKAAGEPEPCIPPLPQGSTRSELVARRYALTCACK